ncbi:MAG: class I SAM-dependent methyltransferase [Gammaproteobacteria bacterium]
MRNPTPQTPPTSYDDEFYRDILDGMSRYLESALLADVLRTLSRLPVSDLGPALNKNQIACKKWLLDQLYRAAGGEYDTVHTLGGWYGVLSALLLNDARFDIAKAVSYDIDPACEPVAQSLNGTHVGRGKFEAVTADMLDLDFNASDHANDVIVNTSCEHLSRFDQWYARLPGGALLVLQSNDYYAIDEHVNCVPDLEAFQRQAPMQDVLFQGELKLKKYTRFMLIGRKRE